MVNSNVLHSTRLLVCLNTHYAEHITTPMLAAAGWTALQLTCRAQPPKKWQNRYIAAEDRGENDTELRIHHCRTRPSGGDYAGSGALQSCCILSLSAVQWRQESDNL